MRGKPLTANWRFDASGGVARPKVGRGKSTVVLRGNGSDPPACAKPLGVICHFGTAQCNWEAKNKVK
ncbi:MAG: hypothetical protein LBE91_03040 [Tannerella sp.]|nr:hypothetical protein [Tannerella sp.]